MTQSTLDTSASSAYTMLAMFEWGASFSSFARYARWDEDLTDGDGAVWSACPQMDVSLGTNHGGTEDNPVTVSLPKGLPPCPTFARVYPHSPVRCTLWEVDPADFITRRALHRGILGKATLNPSGRTGIVRLVSEGPKVRMRRAMGLPATSTCPWVFGDHVCRKDYSSLVKTTTVTALSVGSPTRVSIGLAPWDALTKTRFRRGQIVVDGLALTIRYVSSADDALTTTLDLTKVPPPEWIDAPCTVLPGCDKRLETCQEVWFNEPNFGGVGIRIPARQPVFET